jgi:rare lipoprotein A
MKYILLFLLLCVNCSANEGVASWYGRENRISSTGKPLNPKLFAAANRNLPIGSKVKVTSIRTKKSVVVTIEDRGPYAKSRIIDLNYLAAKKLGILKCGITKVKLERI